MTQNTAPSFKAACRVSLYVFILLAIFLAQTGVTTVRAGSLLQTGEPTSPGAVTDTPTPVDPGAAPGPEDTATPTEPASTPTPDPTQPPELSPTPTAAPKTDAEAIQSALDQAIGAKQEQSLAYMLYKVQIDHIQYNKDRRLALVWLAFVDPQTSQVIATEPGLAIAQRATTRAKNWKITLQVDTSWKDILKKVPAAMLSAQMRSELSSPGNPGEIGAQANQVFTGYKLPWAGGTSNYVTGSIGHVLTYKSCPETCMYAFDFADGTMFPIVAAKSGRVKYAQWSYANGNTSNANYLVLEDASTTPTTYMVYYHLAKDSIPPELRVVGAPVNQGQFIALADDTGYSTGHHLHFHVHTNASAVWGTSVDITFEDVTINGGRPRTCSESAAYPQYGAECMPGNRLMSGNSTGPLPPSPSVIAPTGTLKSSYPTFQWSAVPNALQYYLYVTKAGATTVSLSKLVNASACSNGVCSFANTSLMVDGSYEFKVRAGAATGWSPFSAVTPFTIYTLPYVPELVYPTGTIEINNPAYTWKAVEGASQYYLMVYSDASASYIIYRTLQAVNVCHADGACSYTSTINVKHGTYKFKVRAGNASGQWSAYSNPMPFKASLAPKPPALGEPLAGTKVTVQRPKYYWTAVSNATKYYLQVYSLTKKATMGSYAITTLNACTGDVCWYKPSLNLAAGQYQFRVRSGDATNGYGDYSAWQPFSVQLVPDPPERVSPSGAITTDSPAYTWKPVPGATSYYLMVWDITANDWIIYRTLSPVNVCHADTGTCWYVSTAHTEVGHSYHWKVRAYNAFGWGAFTPWMEFNMVQ